ncbi:putative cytoplasmic protein [Salmonella enterica subsp. enterica]|nr:putative cytoplasmic protein [Salmonella enterica subsp. enterica] [Salmonella enterica subsp. enterica serovar Menston]
MKQDMWELRKIQSQGITDNAQYPAGTYIVFTAAAPYIPLFEQHGKDDIALSLVRHEEAWWIVNHSDELCCAVNEQVMEPHHRMRLNDGDTIEWGLSSWCLARTNDESRPDVSFLSWFSHLNPLLSTWIWTGLNNNSSIRRTRSILFPSGKPHPLTPAMKRIARYTSFTRNISRHCGPPGRKSPSVINRFPEMKTLSPRI